MKRYEKPRLDKRGILSVATAQTVPSDFAPPPDDGGNNEGGVIV